MAPDKLTLVKISSRELYGLGKFIGACRYVDYPDMGVALGIQVAFIVTSIDSTADDVYVGFVLAVRWSVSWFRSILFALGLLDVFVGRGAHEGNPLSVRRPDRIGSSFWQVGNDPSFATRE